MFGTQVSCHLKRTRVRFRKTGWQGRNIKRFGRPEPTRTPEIHCTLEVAIRVRIEHLLAIDLRSLCALVDRHVVEAPKD